MNKKIAIIGLVLTLVLFSTFVGSAFAQRRGSSSAAEETNCATMPPSTLSLGAFTGGIAFIFAGGIGPIVILVLAFLIGMGVSYALWAGF